MISIVSTGLIKANLRLRGGGGDFFVHWMGIRAFAFETTEPYSGDVAASTQRLVYGRSARPGEEPFILDTPFHLLLLYFPFSLIPEAALARSIFTLVLELALCSLVIISLLISEQGVPRILFVIFVLVGLLSYYSFQAIFEANPVVLLGLLYGCILLSLRLGTDELTGAMIAVSLYYWEVGAPFLSLVLLRVYYEKRMRIYAGLFMVSFILLSISLLLYPDWLLPFLRATVNNLKFDFGYNIFTVLSHFWPGQGVTIAWFLIITLIILLGYEWNASRGSDFRRFYWAACITLSATHLLGFRSEMENLVVLVLPLALIFSSIYDRWGKTGKGLVATLMLLLNSIPWIIHLSAVDGFGKMTNDILFLFLPLVTLVGLYWIRWWLLKKPRTWVDLVNRQLQD